MWNIIFVDYIKLSMSYLDFVYNMVIMNDEMWLEKFEIL